jgi:hypothetical protein
MTLTNAERQARWRARQREKTATAGQERGAQASAADAGGEEEGDALLVTVVTARAALVVFAASYADKNPGRKGAAVLRRTKAHAANLTEDDVAAILADGVHALFWRINPEVATAGQETPAQALRRVLDQFSAEAVEGAQGARRDHAERIRQRMLAGKMDAEAVDRALWFGAQVFWDIVEEELEKEEVQARSARATPKRGRR